MIVGFKRWNDHLSGCCTSDWLDCQLCVCSCCCCRRRLGAGRGRLGRESAARAALSGRSALHTHWRRIISASDAAESRRNETDTSRHSSTTSPPTRRLTLDWCDNPGEESVKNSADQVCLDRSIAADHCLPPGSTCCPVWWWSWWWWSWSSVRLPMPQPTLLAARFFALRCTHQV